LVVAAALTTTCGGAASTAPASLCQEICEKSGVCQANGGVGACNATCESFAAQDRAIGCASQDEAFQRCMVNNIVCAGRDIDYFHVAERCSTESMALTECERLDGGGRGTDGS